ncbi:MAG: hypothetical protein M3N28_09610 [Actinomycetota bacterium]|nr:hypothetical protein [Actinomycetota bacterium]
MRLFVLSGMVLWVGATLLLSQFRWFTRPPLVARLRPYTSGSSPGRVHSGPFSVESFRQVVGPLSSTVGERVARLFGVSESWPCAWSASIRLSTSPPSGSARWDGASSA